MSLVRGLASRVVAVGEDLPVGQVTVAADRIRRATGVLAATLRTSAAPPPTPLLVAAGDHLDSAAGALVRARAELDRYVLSLGLAGAPVMPCRDRAVPHVTSGASRSWWVERVDALTACAGEIPPPRSAVDLFARAIAAAHDGDRAGLRAVLAAAPAPAGLALAPVAAERARDLAAAVADPERVRRAARDRLPALLPGLDPVAVAELAARACREQPAPRPPDAPPRHPADPAVAGVALVATLLHLTGTHPSGRRNRA